jgi:S-adenosyl methyltransferase
MTETADDQRWDPDLGIDVSVAHPARVYDYWLGRKVEVVHTAIR